MLPDEIAMMLDTPRRRFEHALDEFESTQRGRRRAARPTSAASPRPTTTRPGCCASGARRRRSRITSTRSWSTRSCSASPSTSRRSPLRSAGALASGAEISAARVRRLYRRLVWIFRAELSTFERKRFASLSHEPNKAMNLNSYLGLMGGRYRIRETPSGAIHLPVRGGSFDLEVPDPDYVLTLDADSMLLPEYCLRLVAYLENAENADVADRPDPVLGVPRRAVAHRAPLRGDDRPAAHRPPGPDPLRRDLLGRGQRDPAQARPRHRHDRGVAQRVRDPPVHQGSHGHRGHRVEHRHAHARLAPRELPRAAQLLGDAARLRRALRPARALGRRRAARAAAALRARPHARRPDAARAGAPRCSCG